MSTAKGVKAVATMSLASGVVGLGAVVFSIVTTAEPGLLVVLVAAVFALGLGVWGRRKEVISPGPNPGGRMANWVVGLGIVAGLLSLAAAAACGLSDATGRSRSQDNLREIALAMQNYHDSYGHFPPQAVCDKDGRPLLSWRVLLVPYLEQDAFFPRFHLDEPWDSEHNLSQMRRMPQAYASTGEPPPEPYTTFYQVLVGPGAAFDGVNGLKLTDAFPDGSAKTVLLVEAGEAVPWTKPADLTYSPDAPLPPLGGMFRGGTPWAGWCKWDGFQAAMADGSVRAFSRKSFREEPFRALITRNGKEQVKD